MSLQTADQLFDAGTYRAAAAAYREALEQGDVPSDRRDEVEYRIGVALGRTEQWDEAVETSLVFYQQHRGTAWEARSLTWLAELYGMLPQLVHEVKDESGATRLFRGEGRNGDGIPLNADGSTPLTRFCAPYNQWLSWAALEAARVRCAEHGGSNNRLHEIGLCLALVRYLRGVILGIWDLTPWLSPSDPVIDPEADYDPAWPAPRKILYLLARVRHLAAGSPGGEGFRVATIFEEAVSLQEYRRFLSTFGEAQGAELRCIFEDRRPEQQLRELAESAHDPRWRERALLMRAVLWGEGGRFADALDELRPLAKGATDLWTRQRAHEQVETITGRELFLESGGTQLSGKPATLRVTYRNLARVHFTVFELDLTAAYAARSWRSRSEPLFPGLQLSWEEARRHYGPRVLQGWLDLPQSSPHCLHTDSVSLPVLEPGAYAIELRAVGKHCAGLVLITDLALVQLRDETSGTIFTADAITGAPQADCALQIRRWDHQDRDEVEHDHTGADGLAAVANSGHAGRWNHYSALASHHGRLAMCGSVCVRPSHRPCPGDFRLHLVTDRPIYRPGQSVFFRLLVMRRDGATWRPWHGATVTARAEAVGRAVLEEIELTTNEWGAATGELSLGADAALGMYSVHVIGLNGDATAGTFRVEEYRKPELSVSVLCDGERVMPGQPTRALVKATYFWGAPVAGARVTYRIYREPEAVEAFPGFGWPRSIPVRAGNTRDVFGSGEVTTDDSGEAQIPFTPSPLGPEEAGCRYCVDVTVQDSSRRAVDATATTRATDRSLHLLVRTGRGYESPGVPLEVEVAAQAGDGTPLSVAGHLRVYRQHRPEVGDDPVEERICEAPAEIGTSGKSVLHWTPVHGGSYRLAFEAWDPEANKEVRGSCVVWVRGAAGLEGPGSALRLRSGRSSHSGSHCEGETARVLVTAPRSGCTVLLAELRGEVSRNVRVLDVPDDDLEIEIPLGAEEVPSVELLAVCIRDGEEFRASERLEVRPAAELAVELLGEREKYRPGEVVTLRLVARSSNGQPVQAELCVAVTDAALSSIQADLTVPIRKAFQPVRHAAPLQVATSAGLRFPGATRWQETCRTYGGGQLYFAVPEEVRPLRLSLGQPAEGSYSLSFAYDFRPPAEREAPEPREIRKSYAYTRYAVLECPMGAAPAASAGACIEEAPGPSGADQAPSGVTRDEAGSIRSQFADTAYWCGSVRTDANGEAAIRFTWPDNLTEWRAFTAGNTRQGELGDAAATLRTAQDLVVRPQAPRFLVEEDEAVLSAVVHNHGDAVLSGTVWARLPDELEVLERPTLQEGRSIAPGGETRVDWRVRARACGLFKLRMGFQSDIASDAAEIELAILTRGARATEVQSGELRNVSAAVSRDRMTIRLPADRRPGTARLVVRTAPTLQGTALDALPYLLDYPYGCVEQTVSRFVPGVLVKHSLLRLGSDAAAFQRSRATAASIEPSLAGPAPIEHTPYTFPEQCAPRPSARMGGEPLNEKLLAEAVRTGLRRLKQAQNADGGWGWWARLASSIDLTAYVVENLLAARYAGCPVPAPMLERGLERLSSRLRHAKEDRPASYPHWRHELLCAAAALAPETAYRELVRETLLRYVTTVREELSPYGLAQLAFALHESGAVGEAAQVLTNLLDRVRTNPHAGTAWWSEHGPRWVWYHHRAEASAAALRAIVRIRPQSPVAPMVVRWLVQNRRGLAWYSTRETAVVIRALLEYADHCGELAPDYTLLLSLGDRTRMECRVRGADSILAPVVWEVPDELLDQEQELVLEKSGPGALYYSASLEYFSTADQIPAAANGLTVRRHYYRVHLVVEPEMPTTETDEELDALYIRPLELPSANPFLTGDLALLDPPKIEPAQPAEAAPVIRWERTALEPGEPLRSGDLIEVELGLEAENDFGYVLIEDIKPAGCEPVDLRSGLTREGRLWIHREFRDEKVALFIERVPQGISRLGYRLRAETPGTFTALPSFAYAMYAPEVQSLSGSRRIEVQDAG